VSERPLPRGASRRDPRHLAGRDLLASQALGSEGADRDGPQGRAIRLAESSRGPWTGDADVDALCEEILLSSSLIDEAYARYGARARRGATYLATFRAVAKHKRPEEILTDLVRTTPGEEGKWFAAAKELGLYAAAIELARTSPCDPRTLARAARDHAAEQPDLAVETGCAALDWLAQGFGYEITSADVRMACSAAMKAAEALGQASEIRERIRALAASQPSFVTEVLGPELGLPARPPRRRSPSTRDRRPTGPMWPPRALETRRSSPRRVYTPALRSRPLAVVA
jgi:hypothetical protein